MPKQLNYCDKGTYIIDSVLLNNIRILEAGFVKDKRIFVISNNILGIRLRLGNVVYFLNKIIASQIFVIAKED